MDFSLTEIQRELVRHLQQFLLDPDKRLFSIFVPRRQGTTTALIHAVIEYAVQDVTFTSFAGHSAIKSARETYNAMAKKTDKIMDSRMDETVHSSASSSPRIVEFKTDLMKCARPGVIIYQQVLKKQHLDLVRNYPTFSVEAQEAYFILSAERGILFSRNAADYKSIVVHDVLTSDEVPKLTDGTETRFEAVQANCTDEQSQTSDGIRPVVAIRIDDKTIPLR